MGGAEGGVGWGRMGLDGVWVGGGIGGGGGTHWNAKRQLGLPVGVEGGSGKRVRSWGWRWRVGDGGLGRR